MRSDEYWEERALQREEYARKAANTTIKNKTLKYYSKAQKDLDTRIKRIFERYSKNGELTATEAKKLLNAKETEEELEKIRKELESIEDPTIRKKALARLNAGAYRARISRLEAIKANIETQQALLADREKKAVKSLLNDVSEETYYHHIFDTQIGAGFAFDFAALPQKTINGIINDKWKGANFSQRVWANTSQAAKNAYDIVTRGIMTGANVRTMAQQLSETMQAGMYASMRLIRTETNRVHNAAEREAYKEEEIENYRFLATLDGRTCEQCGRLDGKTFPVEDAKEGVNFPPLHPNDRCTTVQAIDEETVKNLKRRARDPETGKTVTVPGNMTWKEWREGLVKSEKDDKIIYKELEKDKNRENDSTADSAIKLSLSDLETFEKWQDDYYELNSNVSFSKEENPNIYEYTGGSYEAINALERGGEQYEKAKRCFGSDLSEYKKISDGISEELSKFKLNTPLLLRRTVGEVGYITGKTSSLEDMKSSIGRIFTEKGFTSTTVCADAQLPFGGFRDTKTTLEIYAPRSTRGAYIYKTSDSPAEFEFLIDKNTKFKVLDAGVREIKIKDFRGNERSERERFMVLEVIV